MGAGELTPHHHLSSHFCAVVAGRACRHGGWEHARRGPELWCRHPDPQVRATRGEEERIFAPDPEHPERGYVHRCSFVFADGTRCNHEVDGFHQHGHRYDPMISSFPVVDTEKLKEVHDHEASHGMPFTPEECREACWRPGEGWGEKKVLYVLEESSTNESGYAGVQSLAVSNASGGATKKRYHLSHGAGTFLFPEEAALCRAAGGRRVLRKILRRPWCDREQCCKKC